MAEKDSTDKAKKPTKNKKSSIDFSTPIGWILGMTVVIIAIYTNAQLDGVIFFIQLASIMIVGGGLAAAILVNFSLSEIALSIKLVSKCMKKDNHNLEEKIELFVSMAKKSRKSGMLSLEEDLETIDDEFIKRGMYLAINGYSDEEVGTILRKEVDSMEERHLKGQDLLEKAGDYSPAWGMIGTLVGLVLMLRDLDDPSTLGPNMAVAMLTTLYGALLANLFFIPLLGKLVIKHNEEMFMREFAIEGIREVQKGQNPSKLKVKLDSYVTKKKAKKKKVSKEPKEEGEKNG
jgi:chemotaxis protein MotA